MRGTPRFAHPAILTSGAHSCGPLALPALRLRADILRHRIAASRAELSGRCAVIDIPRRLIEAMRGLGAGQGATAIASLGGSGFERPQQRTADAAKPRIGCDIVQPDLAGVGYGPDSQDGIALDRKEKRVSLLPWPSGHDFRCLVGEPPGLGAERLGEPQRRPTARRWLTWASPPSPASRGR